MDKKSGKVQNSEQPLLCAFFTKIGKNQRRKTHPPFHFSKGRSNKFVALGYEPLGLSIAVWTTGCGHYELSKFWNLWKMLWPLQQEAVCLKWFEFSGYRSCWNVKAGKAMGVEIFLRVFLTKLLLPCFHGIRRGWHFYEHFIPPRAGIINQRAAEGKQNPEIFFLFVPSFHSVPRCSALPELGKSREYREEPGATWITASGAAGLAHT